MKRPTNKNSTVGQKKSKVEKKADKKKPSKSLAGGYNSKPTKRIENIIKKGNFQDYHRTKAGITVVHYSKCNNPNSPAFVQSAFLAFENDMKIKDKHKIIAVVGRRVGVESDEIIMQGGEDDSQYPWNCALVISGTDSSAAAVEKDMKALAATVNGLTTQKSAQNKWPKKTHHGKDLTPEHGPLVVPPKARRLSAVPDRRSPCTGRRRRWIGSPSRSERTHLPTAVRWAIMNE